MKKIRIDRKQLIMLIKILCLSAPLFFGWYGLFTDKIEHLFSVLVMYTFFISWIFIEAIKDIIDGDNEDDEETTR